jgi:hypothetical protein
MIKKLNFDELRKGGYLLYEYIRGSQSHGLDTETSDIDTGGVYIAPEDEFFSMNCRDHISSEKNDDSWWELGNFAKLISESDPNALESLFVPDECILYCSPLFEEFRKHRDEFISKKSFYRFGGYAANQIERARGLNKMISMPDNMERKTPLDFCFTTIDVNGNQGSVNFDCMFQPRDQKKAGLSKIPNMPGMYYVFYDETGTKGYRGIVADDSNELRLSSIPKGEKPIFIISYNASAYSQHCKKYKEWKEWKEKRNPVRYQSNLHKNYDAKNVCECFRLVTMAIEIANGEGVKCDRRNIDRDFLLSIKQHKFEYDEIMRMLERRKSEMDEAFRNSKIRKNVDKDWIESKLVEIKKKFYAKNLTIEK